MAIGYLIPAVLLTWCTFFAIGPRRQPGSIGFLVYRSSFLINEMPFVAIYWLIASMLLALSQGDVDSVTGRLAFALTMVTLVGLAVVVWRGARSHAVVENALQKGLGSGWRATIDAKLASGLGTRLPLRGALLNPFFVRRFDVERIANVSYGDAGAMNLLDVYRHRSRPTDGPILVHFHGGAFVSGRKNREALPLIYRLASRGWICISANYRLVPAASFPDPLVDAKQVLAWVRNHGGEYGGDATTVFVAGTSAGAYLASFAALTPNESELQPGFEDAETSVTAAICLYGYYGETATDHPRLQSSPMSYVNSDAPPFFFIHGDHDSIVPVEQARDFTTRLRAVSTNPVVYAELPGAQHTFDLFHSIRTDTVVNGIEAFAAWARTTR